jgi:hypothetical protein
VIKARDRRSPPQYEDAEGINRQEVVEDTEAEVEEPGSSEAIPQVGIINDQRNDAGKSNITNEGADTGERGYCSQELVKSRCNLIASKSKSHSNDYGTPYEEKGNPIEAWKQNSQPCTNVIPLKVLVSVILERHGLKHSRIS